MKARQVYGFRSLSLAVTALVRSSAGLKNTQSRFHLVTKACFTAVPSYSALHSSLQSPCSEIQAHESHDASGVSGTDRETDNLTIKRDFMNFWHPYELIAYIVEFHVLSVHASVV